MKVQIDIGLVAEALSVGLAVVAFYFNGKYRKIKKAVKDLAEAVSTTQKAIEDDEITSEELKSIVKEWKEVLEDIAELKK